jgi:hypothetical protein
VVEEGATMKQLDGRPGRFPLRRRVVTLLAVVATISICVRAIPSHAMTEIDDLIRKIELERDSENQIRYAYHIQELVCHTDPAEFSDELIDQLIGLVLNANELVGVHSANALVCIGPPAKRAIPALERALDMARRYEGWIAPEADGSQVIVLALQELKRMQ